MPVIRFVSEMKKLPTTSVKCYQFREPTVTEESVGKIAEAFGIHYDQHSLMDSTLGIMPKRRVTIEKNNLGYVLKKGQQYLSVANASGAIEYKNLSTFSVDLGKSIDFSDEEAVAKAKENVRQLDLVPFSECRLLKIKHFTIGNSNLISKIVTSHIVNVSVVFQRIIDDIPVEGPGGKLAVVLDANGELCGVHRVWRDIVPEKSMEIKLQPAVFAQESLTERFNKFKDMVIEVPRQDFGYWEMGTYETQKYLQPVFVTQFDIIGPAGSTNRKGIHVAPAGINPMPGLKFNTIDSKTIHTRQIERRRDV